MTFFKANTKKQINKIFEFIKFSEKLKIELRNGYTSSERKESVAEHCWRMSLFVMLFSSYLDKKIDLEKVLKMAIIHDIAEILTGDVPYFFHEWNKKNKKKKQSQEQTAMNQISKMLPKKLGKELYNLWLEYEKNNSYEAKFVKAVDKMEAQIQHNQIDIKHWNAYDIKFASKWLNRYCDFDSALKLMRKIIQDDSANKIAKNLKSDSKVAIL